MAVGTFKAFSALVALSSNGDHTYSCDKNQMESRRDSAPQSALHVAATQSVLAESEVRIVLRLGPGFAGQELHPRCG